MFILPRFMKGAHVLYECHIFMQTLERDSFHILKKQFIGSLIEGKNAREEVVIQV